MQLPLKLATLLCASLSLIACTSPPATPSPSDTTDAPLALYLFDCGNIHVKNIALFSPGFDEGQTKDLTNTCYLIKHPKGNLLWDTGLNDDTPATGVDVGDDFRVSVANPLMQQLKAIDIAPNDIDYLGMSHFHFDHIGNANQFSSASWFVQQEEYDAAYSAEPEKYFFDPKNYSQLNKAKAKVLNGDHDVFGDGSVVIKRAVGHTPGHQLLFVNLAETGPVVLSGDLYHFTKNRTHKRVPGFNFNKEQTMSSFAAIEAFVNEKNAKLCIKHDLEQNKELKHSPSFYQ